MGTGEKIPGAFSDMINLLNEIAQPIPNDKRQQRYCELINLFLSHFGNERFLLSGSTPQRTRLRANKNEGDFDFLVVSEKVISAEHLEHNPNVPCFVRIRGDRLQDTFPTIQMIDGKYLPSDLLKNMRPEAFKHVKNICTIMSTLRSIQGENTRRISLDMKIKPGISLVIYANPQCVELDPRIDGQTDDTMNQITHGIQRKFIAGSEVLLRNISTVTERKRTRDDSTDYVDPEDTNQPGPSRCKKAKVQNITQFFQGNFIAGLVRNISTVVERKCTYEYNSGTSDDSTDNFDLENTNQPGPSKGKKAKAKDRRKDKTHSVVKGVERDDLTRLSYSYKTSKDFIPVFPIRGPLKALSKFKTRVRRKWPSPSIIDDICKCELFVISKPALVDTDDNKDFCIAFNNAEMVLANCMTEVQRTVLLILKAYQKGILREISDDLTTFHWKSALYWVSEKTESTILDTFSYDNVLKLLDAVLVHMANGLCTQYLEHYFLPSNLFASRNEEDLLKMIPKIVELQEHPIEQLQEFFNVQNDGKLNFEMVPISKIQEINNKGESSLVEPIISTLRDISLEDKEKLRVALKSILKDGLEFFLDEITPEIDSNARGIFQLIQSRLNVDATRNSVINGVVSVLIKTTEKERWTPNLIELMQLLLCYF